MRQAFRILLFLGLVALAACSSLPGLQQPAADTQIGRAHV